MTSSTNGDNTIPPKLSFKAPDSTAAETEKKHTSRVDLPPPAAAEGAAPLKKKTSRIPLDQVSAEPGAAPGSPVAGVGAAKTIRLSPAGPVPTITITPSPKAISGALVTEDIRRQTSRIPLEAAATTSETATGGSPKTIRIKRPAGLATTPILTPTEPAAAAAAASAAVEPTGKSVTSRIDMPEEGVGDTGQATQRKTIKIRRPDGSPAKAVPRSMAVARVEAQAAARVAEENVAAPHAVFPILAAAAVVLLCVMVYVLLMQAFPDLGWNFPGKVTL